MSIALNIIKIAEEELHKADGSRIEKMQLSVGKLSGIVVESLEFALQAARDNSPLANTEIEISEIPARMRCTHCNQEFEAEQFYTICPHCDSFQHEIISGKELVINSITIAGSPQDP